MLRKYKKYLPYLIKGFIVLNAFLILVWFQGQKTKSTPIQPQQNFPEVAELTGQNWGFNQLKDYFITLANTKGAEYAYQVLRIAPMPPNTDMHLMGHVVGDELFKQKGIEGIKICTDDFRNACSHSIVVGLLLSQGEKVLPQISAACKQAPGGSGAYTMCYHGLGHGVLAYTDYELPKAVELCQKTGDEEGVQCIGGAIMEIISGGDHDKQLWRTQRTKYLMADRPFYPCLNSFVPEKARHMCLTYLTPYLFEAAGADIGSPTPEDFEKAFTLCPQLEKQYQNICYGGFGKEFTVLAQNRDIRKMEEMTSTQLTTVYNWCKLAKDEDGIQACNSNALSSLFWGGENDRAVSIRFCNVMDNQTHTEACFNSLINAVKFYITDLNYKKQFCTEIPTNFQANCNNLLTNN